MTTRPWSLKKLRAALAYAEHRNDTMTAEALRERIAEAERRNRNRALGRAATEFLRDN